MSLISGSIKDILSIKLKCRHDAFTDQYSRIFMTKMFIISSIIMSVDFFNDKVSCMMPSKSDLSKDFVHSACWIQGFYIYKEMKYRGEESGYFGLPRNVLMDGMTLRGKLCEQFSRSKKQWQEDEDCLPMTKVFYTQYQFLPFFIAALAVLYYIPYIVFRMVNSDIVSLKTNLKSATTMCPKKIVENYFDYQLNGGRTKLRVRIILNVLIKCLYVTVNILGFYFTDKLLNGNYRRYGIDWLNWAKLNNSLAYDYNGERGFPKPGNYLLPAMGFCEIAEGSSDVKSAYINHNKFICEISPNVLYQYVMLVLWYFYVIGIVTSCLGVVSTVLSYLVLIIKRFMTCRGVVKNKSNKIYVDMTIREIEYLQFIRKKNLNVYGDVLRHLRKTRVNNNGLELEMSDVEINRNMRRSTSSQC